MIEYYNGILFLTTNRPGVLDEAVKSRIHLNLLYKPLNLDQTTAIFKLNIERLKEREDQRARTLKTQQLYVMEQPILDFAKDHFEKSEENSKRGRGRWNGRQIRNAFLMAASLAHFEARKNPGMQAQLRAEHFKEVHEVTRIYDEYRASAIGATDNERAAEEHSRADVFE